MMMVVMMIIDDYYRDNRIGNYYFDANDRTDFLKSLLNMVIGNGNEEQMKKVLNYHEINGLDDGDFENFIGDFPNDKK